MKLLASALVALFFLPAESALGQESRWDKLMTLSPGTKMEVVDAESGTVQGQLVSIDDEGLTIHRKGNGSAVTETIARADVVSVTVKRPSAKRIALFALGGSALGALAGGSRCKGPTDTVTIYTPTGPLSSSTCHNANGYYFDSKGGAIGAGAGAALGLLGFAFPERKILYARRLIAKSADPSSSSTAADSVAQKESSPQSLPVSAGDNSRESDGVLPTKTDHKTKFSAKGDCYAAQE